MRNFLKISTKPECIIGDGKFYDEIFNIDNIDYYYSNVISRASKTMTECRNLRLSLKKTGTEG